MQGSPLVYKLDDFCKEQVFFYDFICPTVQNSVGHYYFWGIYSLIFPLFIKSINKIGLKVFVSL